MRVVERADGGLALVLNLLAVLQQGNAGLVGIALLALGGSGDGRHIGLDGLAIGTAALLCGERGEDDAIVGFSAVGGGVFQVDAGGFEALDEVVGRIDTRDGALRAFQQARVEFAGIVGGVAVHEVQLLGVDSGGGERLQQRFGLIEGDDERRVGVGCLDGGDDG